MADVMSQPGPAPNHEYTRLSSMEAHCKQLRHTITTKSSHEQWRSLTAAHMALIHEYYDMFATIQHKPASRLFTLNYQLLKRLWEQALQAPLDLLRYWLPHTIEHAKTFIYTAYRSLTLLYETVPCFRETWVEYLGDIARYYSHLRFNDPEDQKTWTENARSWYKLVSTQLPEVGRLYHKQALLIETVSIWRLALLTQSLVSTRPCNVA